MRAGRLPSPGHTWPMVPLAGRKAPVCSSYMAEPSAVPGEVLRVFNTAGGGASGVTGRRGRDRCHIKVTPLSGVRFSGVVPFRAPLVLGPAPTGSSPTLARGTSTMWAERMCGWIVQTVLNSGPKPYRSLRNFNLPQPLRYWWPPETTND